MDSEEAELRTKGSTNDEDEDVVILYERKKPEVTQSPARLDMLLQKAPLVSTVKCTPSQLSQPCHSSRSLLRANPLVNTQHAASSTKGSTNDEDEDVVILCERKKPEVTQSPARLDMLLQKAPLVSTVKCTPSQLSQPCHSSRSLLRANPLVNTQHAASSTKGSTNDVAEDRMLYVRKKPEVTQSPARLRKLLPKAPLVSTVKCGPFQLSQLCHNSRSLLRANPLVNTQHAASSTKGSTNDEDEDVVILYERKKPEVTQSPARLRKLLPKAPLVSTVKCGPFQLSQLCHNSRSLLRANLLVNKKNAALTTTGSTNDVDENVMPYVRDKPKATQNPGRLRKLLPKVQEKSAEFIFVPPVNPSGNRKFKPHSARRHVVSTVKCAPSQLSQPCQSSRSLLRPKSNQQELGLVEAWDVLPEKQLPDTIKRMIAPLDEPLPEMAVNIHKEIEECNETEEKKIEQIIAWLLETPSTPTPPKVVVQAEPELDGQWSALQDQKTE